MKYIFALTLAATTLLYSATAKSGVPDNEVHFWSADKSTFGCSEIGQLRKLKSAKEIGDYQAITELTIGSRSCYPIWNGSRGYLIEGPIDDMVKVSIFYLHKFPAENQPVLWVFGEFLYR